MRKLIYISIATVASLFASCSQSDFEDAYKNPATVETTTVPKQFAGFMKRNWEDVIPAYWNYFTVIRQTSLSYTQAHGFTNISGRYVVGAASLDRWGRFYGFLAQYRELERVMAALPASEQTANRIYTIASTIYLYEHAEKMVDNFGDIPFSEAGKISMTGGNYASANAKYDSQEAIYTKMLDDLKAFSTELNTITLTPKVDLEFKNQDLINKGNLTKWKKYCNSLRLRMLNRVSAVPAFQARATTEMAEIISGGNYVATNADNIEFKVYNQDTKDSGGGTILSSEGFKDGLESWNNNAAPKLMIDHMNTNNDPRKPWLFEPGTKANGVYIGLDQMDNSVNQDKLMNQDAVIAIYNRSALSRNKWFPGTLINAPEMNLIVAEYYVRTGNIAAAKTAYETAIRQSVDFYVEIAKRSNDTGFLPATVPTAAEVDAYIAMPAVNFALATTPAARMALIGFQRYIHFNVVQPEDSWTEQRRTNLPVMNFLPDNGNAQTTPPVRWTYPGSEKTYNGDNYAKVSAKDNLNTKIFWDLN
ncbi:SusD/RagB family nutrient-binding outer membrane lipoprotein [Flavobacterium gilvum]|uniref:SusD/RagB family nutrient-binding outer membrane lipoprotein n=1 Tax=Flavobacterium gilvum TaxID=1492737 RepID=A0AAC9N486_9FLAO|nr:SusD/RagB family nutrient-binding outer membrane lipoprotein [Flavobacterium gilvum]AOW10285.1 hypothetical protein EM308_12645 [Flavobacterium gilvum]KFC58837.1 hypothetical protein FEM08_23810 [Flavobacterium gilvum]